MPVLGQTRWLDHAGIDDLLPLPLTAELAFVIERRRRLCGQALEPARLLIATIWPDRFTLCRLHDEHPATFPITDAAACGAEKQHRSVVRALKRALVRARDNVLTILFLDEIDSFSERGSDRGACRA
jgi:hypothetical protein